jgi:hypothetical protein
MVCSTASRTLASAAEGERFARFSQPCSIVFCKSVVMTILNKKEREMKAKNIGVRVA